MAANTNNSSQDSPVRQLRLVVEATNFEAALAFYKDVLGLPLLESFEVDDSEARTAELANAGGNSYCLTARNAVAIAQLSIARPNGSRDHTLSGTGCPRNS